MSRWFCRARGSRRAPLPLPSCRCGAITRYQCTNCWYHSYRQAGSDKRTELLVRLARQAWMHPCALSCVLFGARSGVGWNRIGAVRCHCSEMRECYSSEDSVKAVATQSSLRSERALSYAGGTGSDSEPHERVVEKTLDSGTQSEACQNSTTAGSCQRFLST